MAVTNPFAITFAGTSVGGSDSGYQLHGPYAIEKSHDDFRLVFDIIVVAASYSELKTKSETIETAFSKRLAENETLIINIGGSSITYTRGETILACEARITKTANPDTDKGFSRSYTVVIEGQLPATAEDGLRDLEVLVQHTQSRQRIVTMRGTYTATERGDAVERYSDEFDTEATTYLDAIDSSAVWELADESYSYDRQKTGGTPTPHLCEFTRQYVELLEDQSSGTRDDASIRDHRITFTDLSQHPGDSRENVRRVRRVVASYDCAVDIEETLDLQTVYETKVRDHLQQLFRDTFNPQVFAIEEQRVSYDETAKRISVSAQFLYQSENGEAVIEISQSVTYREQRTIDYTPTHEPNELSAAVDIGFAVLERVWNRTVIVIGEERPKLRIAGYPIEGDAGLFNDEIAGEKAPDESADRRKLSGNGWNIISNTSQVTPQWIGDPETNQVIRVSVLTENVIERFNYEIGTRTAVPIQRQAITP